MSVVIDPVALAALAVLQRPGKPDVAARVFALFESETPKSLRAIRDGVAGADLDVIRVAAHTIKSSAAYVGARDLSEACALVERAARAGDLPECTGQSAGLDDLFAQTLSALDRLFPKAA